MKVHELVKILRKLDQNAIIDMATDEEGNAFGDIDEAIAEGMLKTGEKVFSLYPSNIELPEDRFDY